MIEKIGKWIGRFVGIVIAVPIGILLFTIMFLVLGFGGYAIGWTLDLVAHPFIYGALDVIPTQPFSKGDLPKLLAIITSIAGMSALVGLGGGNRYGSK